MVHKAVGDAMTTPSDRECVVLEGANPSAEGGDDEEGGDSGQSQQKLDIEDEFRLNKLEGGMDKKTLTNDLKGATLFHRDESQIRY